MKFNPRYLKSGSILKYESPASGVVLTTPQVEYNFDDFFTNLPTNEFSTGPSETSIAWTPNWKDKEGRYTSVQALEADPKYKAFTEYVISHPDDPKVKNYLKLLEQSTVKNGHAPILFNGENLVENWAQLYKNLRNDGKYGYYHLGSEGTEVEQKPEIEPEIEPEEEPEEEPDPHYDPQIIQYDKPKTSKITIPDEPLWHAGTWGRNLGAIIKNHKLELDKEPSLHLPQRDEYKVTAGDYYTMNRLRQQAADYRSAANATGVSSNMDELMAAQDNAEKYALQKELQELQHRESWASNTNLKLTSTQTSNNANAIKIANENMDKLKANASRIATANLTMNTLKLAADNELADGIVTDLKKAQETKNINDKKKQINDINKQYTDYINGLTEQYYSLTNNYTNSEVWQLFVNYVLTRNSKEELGNLFDPSIFNGFDPQHPENASPELISALKTLWALDFGKPFRDQHKEQVKVLYMLLRRALNLAASLRQGLIRDMDYLLSNSLFLFQNPYRTSTVYAKSGTKLDRMLQFAKIHLREDDSQRKANAQYRKINADLLKRDLDALDKETIALLKIMFK